MQKKYFIVATSLAVIMFAALGFLIYDRRYYTADYFNCVKSQGQWKKFNSICASTENMCGFNLLGISYECAYPEEKIFFSCNCGPNRCLSDGKCVDKDDFKGLGSTGDY